MNIVQIQTHTDLMYLPADTILKSGYVKEIYDSSQDHDVPIYINIDTDCLKIIIKILEKIIKLSDLDYDTSKIIIKRCRQLNIDLDIRDIKRLYYRRGIFDNIRRIQNIMKRRTQDLSRKDLPNLTILFNKYKEETFDNVSPSDFNINKFVDNIMDSNTDNYENYIMHLNLDHNGLADDLLEIIDQYYRKVLLK